MIIYTRQGLADHIIGTYRRFNGETISTRSPLAVAQASSTVLAKLCRCSRVNVTAQRQDGTDVVLHIERGGEDYTIEEVEK